MAIDERQRDVGGIFLSADVPGPTFRSPIPFDELKVLAERHDFVALSKSIVMDLRPTANGAKPAA